MPKLISSASLALLDENEGVEPIIIVAIIWSEAIIGYYCSKKTTIGSLELEANILDISSINLQKTQDNMGTTGSATITFDDIDNRMKNNLALNVAEKASVGIYQTFEGLGPGDWILLLKGRISNPVWSEGERSVQLRVESEIEIPDIGYAPTLEDFPDLMESAYNVPWPMIFGKCAHVPAVQVRQHASGVLMENIKITSKIYDFNAVGELILDNECKMYNVHSFKIEGSFPQNNKVKIIIGTNDDLSAGVVFEGTFNGEIFTPSSVNVPKYTNISITKTGDFDYERAFYIEDDINLANHHCFFTSTSGVPWYNYCEKQFYTTDGIKCFFRYPFIHPNTRQPIKRMPLGIKIEEAYGIQINGITNDVGNDIYSVLISCQLRRTSGTSVAEVKRKYGAIVAAFNKLKEGNYGFWNQSAGATVRLWDAADPDIYVVSLIECSSIGAVYAYKKELIGGKEKRVFRPVPKEYYTKQLTSNYAVDGGFATAILFATPLKDRSREDWEDQIYVTATSTVGPNVSNIIRYLLERFTDFDIDFGNFNSIIEKVANKPANFVIFDRKNALEIIREIAWQAKCALLTSSSFAKLIYLPDRPPVTRTFNQDNIDFGSLRTESTSVSNIITRLIGSWNDTYKDTPRASRHKRSAIKKAAEIIANFTDTDINIKTANKLTIYENNILKYGEHSEDIEIYIYNEESFVKDTLAFWGYRYSNTWRKVRFKTYMHGLIFEPFDGARLMFTDSYYINSLSMFCLVEEINYDFKDKTTELLVWLPSRTGTTAEDSIIYV